MKKYLLLLLVLTACKIEKESANYDFTTRFEKSNGTETATYQEIVEFYETLAETYPAVKFRNSGRTDSGEFLKLVTLNPSPETNYNNIREKKRIIFINNGIHPGESDGIDATMMLFRDIVQGKIELPEHVMLATIPVYNVGGALNRNSGTRANQNGPEEYGFRGNAKNYDLNRDFIKSDTRNASSFARIFHALQPDVLIDNHVSNGADYQYTLTHLFTQHDKLGGALGKYLHNEMIPSLEKDLQAKDWDITPYVNVFNRTPEQGFSQFLDSPRYSTGYTTLWNTLGMMVETHMLKPYKQRVEGTYELMKSMMELVERDHEKIKSLREQSDAAFRNAEHYSLQWEIDSTSTSILNFKGFEGEMIISEVTGSPRLKYDRNKPFTKKIPYYNFFKPKKDVTIPKAYLVPKVWRKVVSRLEFNDIELEELKDSDSLDVEVYRIESYETYSRPYEGHYPHYNTSVSTSVEKVYIDEDDYYLVNTDQRGIRYLLETLEPTAPDSFFNWNFFDTILQQKEGFSPYVWEDEALKLLERNDPLKSEFETKKLAEPDFASNWYAQLDWLFKRSANYEKAHLRYPVYRIAK